MKASERDKRLRSNIALARFRVRPHNTKREINNTVVPCPAGEGEGKRRGGETPL